MSEPDYITATDIRMFDFFNTERTPITRWCDWENRKYLFEKEYPEYFEAMKAFDAAEKELSDIISKVIDTEMDRPDN